MGGTVELKSFHNNLKRRNKSRWAELLEFILVIQYFENCSAAGNIGNASDQVSSHRYFYESYLMVSKFLYFKIVYTTFRV
jgi:hypothetical protein